MMRIADVKDVCEGLAAIVRSLPLSSFQHNGEGRRFSAHVPVDDVLVTGVFTRFGLVWRRSEPDYGHFVGNNYEAGAHVHPHTDPAPPGFHHVRCNVALEMPISGGNPVISGVEVPVQEGQAWVCFASLERHSSVPVVSGTRVIFSLGGLIPQGEAEVAYRRVAVG